MGAYSGLFQMLESIWQQPKIIPGVIFSFYLRMVSVLNGGDILGYIAFKAISKIKCGHKNMGVTIDK